MRHALPLTATVVLLAAELPAGVSHGREATPHPTIATRPERALARSLGTRAYAHIAADTTLVASWTFDDGLGGPDPQGWTTHDRSAQIATFFHVDDFSGLASPYLFPLSGTQSMWCGARPCEPMDVCSYAVLPGYGNKWHQEFQSVGFEVTGDVTIEFLAHFNSEPSYDFTHLEYSTGGGPWQTIDSFSELDWGEPQYYVRTIPAVNHSGDVTFRFRFKSDQAFSDEDGLFNVDGAVVLDSMTVRDGGGVIDFQDFESESPGALTTADGDWQAGGIGAFGDYGGLFDGATVLQEDTLVTNETFLWGFFNGSPDTYACGGHPEQAAVPYPQTIDGDDVSLFSEIRSPEIDLTGLPGDEALFLMLDAYMDLADIDGVFMHIGVRSRVGGIWYGWRLTNLFPDGNSTKQWTDVTFNVSARLNDGATAAQIAIAVADELPAGSGACHSHAPLIDNVRLVTIPEVLTVTTTADNGPGSLYQALSDASPTPNAGVILFDIPGPGPHVISADPLKFAYINSPLVIDGTSQPGYAGTPLIRIQGPNGALELLRANAPTSLLGLELATNSGPYPGTGRGISLNATSVVQGCVIRDVTKGIFVNSIDNVIGGTQAGEGNTFIDCREQAVLVSAGTGNVIRGNSIHNTGTPNGFGIDLIPEGVNANDALDADGGANNGQNHPVLTNYYQFSSVVTGVLQSVPGTTYLIDFYLSPECDPAGYGEGETYLTSLEVTTDSSGEAPISTALGALPSDGVITATATDPDGNTSEFSACIPANQSPTGVGDATTRAFALHPNVPNPFNPTTTISFDVPAGGAHVTIRIYDVSGRLVRTLVDGRHPTGTHAAMWDGRNATREPVSSGVYFYRMVAGSFVEARRMVLLK